MTRVGYVHYLDLRPKSVAKGTAVLGRGDAVHQTLHDEKWYLPGWIHPIVLRRRAVCCSLGGGQRGPTLHLTQNPFCRGGIGDELFGRLETVGLCRVLSKPCLECLDDPGLGDDEPDSGEQDDAAHEIRAIRGQASRDAIAEAVADHMRWP